MIGSPLLVDVVKWLSLFKNTDLFWLQIHMHMKVFLELKILQVCICMCMILILRCVLQTHIVDPNLLCIFLPESKEGREKPLIFCFFNSTNHEHIDVFYEGESRDQIHQLQVSLLVRQNNNFWIWYLCVVSNLLYELCWLENLICKSWFKSWVQL